MRYNRLGNTGLVVSELCLGAMTFGHGNLSSMVGGLDQEASTALVKQAADGGINFIDTANIYSHGASEVSVARALKDLGIARSEMIIATKAGGPIGKGPNDGGAHPQHLLAEVDRSLAALATDYIDLYQIHCWDALTPLEETLRALEDIVRSGRARYVGVSNWAAWQMMKALGIADRLGFSRLASVQAYYTVAGRDLEREIVPMLASEGLGLLVWSPLAGGLLSGKYRPGSPDAEGRRARFNFPPVDGPRADSLIEAMAPMADKRGGSIAQIALAWLLHQRHVTSVIVGATKPDQLADNIAACAVELTEAELAELATLSALPAEYPGWAIDGGMMSREGRVSPRRGG
jgi:aryl-alcohol dehydrogenase-like predicted oxidoreductase